MKIRETSDTKLIVRGDYVWTGDALLPDGAVVAVDGVVQAVGPWAELRTAHEGGVVGGPGHIVLPGLINAHHHGNGVTSFVRGVVDDHLEMWLANLSQAPAIDPYDDTLLAAMDTVRGGYTTMVLFQSTARPEDAFEEAVARIDAARSVGVRVAFGLDVTQRNFYVYGPDPQGWPARRGLSAEEYIHLLNKLSNRYHSDPLVQIFAAPSGPEWVADDTWAAVGEWSKVKGAPLHTHALESPIQAEFARRHFPRGLAAHLDGLGALHGGTALVHGVYLQEADFALMSARGASLITNPGSNLRLRCGVSPVLRALARGVNVALGTDGFSLGDRDDALAEMRLLFYLQRDIGWDAPALTWEQALAAGTRAGARVTPWQTGGPDSGPVLGAVAPGMKADLTVFNLNDAAGPWRHPDVHPVHLLLHRGNREHVVAVVVEGRVVWDVEKGYRLIDGTDAVVRVQERLWQAQDKILSAPVLAGRLGDVVLEYYRKWLAPVPPGP